MLEEDQLVSPSSEYRPIPIWFWNGDLDEEELCRQVRTMAEGGLGGFQIAARTGLSTPYLSSRWFGCVEAVTREAQRHGLQVWLADEYPYPSGASGGELTLRHPEYRAWQMRAHSLTAGPGQSVECLAPGSILLYAAAAPIVNGVTDWTRAIDLRDQVGISQPEPVFVEPAFGYSGKRTFAFGPRPKLSWTARSSSSWEIWLVAAAELAPYKFYGHYVDLCNPEAVGAFLETTYQRYVERLDPTVLRQIAGFFLDEAHPQSWSWELPTAFQERTGYDLLPVLPALWTDIGPKTAQVRYDYWQTITTRFVESFHRPIAEWCQAHNLLLSLEVDSPRNLVQRYADIGGNDPGHEKVGLPLEEIRTPPRPRYRVNPRFAASLAAQVGRNRVLDESFHSAGWSLTLQDMKAMVDRLAAQGANLFVFHAFFYTVDGLRKWDAPPSQFLQNPYWPHFPRFTDYVGRLCYALSGGQRVAPVALVDPITSLWSHGGVGTGVAGPGPGPDALATRIGADWQYLMGELEAAQRPFDTLDPLLLAEGTVDQGTLRLGNATYRVIVLPPLTSLEAAAWAKIEEFAASGGQVVACGRLPDEQIEPASDIATRCAAFFDANPAQLRQKYEHPAAQ
ncbi:MAG TPA: glycosyl hydrolase, partial [Chloroflexota bacterium]|nr:glycosyl hydrolase [Chloroflexota bacterium]